MSNLASKYKSIAPSNITVMDKTTADSITSAARTDPFISSKCPTASKTSSLFGNESLNSSKFNFQTMLKSKHIISDSNVYFSLPPFKSQSSIASKLQDELKTKSSQFPNYDSTSDSTTESSSSLKQPTIWNSKYVYCSNKVLIGLPPFKRQLLISSIPQEVCKTKSLFHKDESFIESPTESSYSKNPSNLLKSKSAISCSNKKYSNLSLSKSQSSITSKPLEIFKTKSPFSKDNSLSDSTTKTSYSTKQPTLLKSKSVIYSNKEFLSLPSFEMKSSIVPKHHEVCKTKPLPYSEDEYFSDSTSKSSSSTKDPTPTVSTCTLQTKQPSSNVSPFTFQTKQPSSNVSTCTFQTKQPSPNVSTCKSQIQSNTDSPYKCEFSEPRIVKTETRPKMKLAVNSESSNIPIIKSQSAPKMKLSVNGESSNVPIIKSQSAPNMESSSLMKNFSSNLPSLVFKQNSSTVSNKRTKRQQRRALKKIQKGTTSVKTDTTKLNMQEKAKTIQMNKEFKKSQITKLSFKKAENVENMVSHIRFVVRDLQSSHIVETASHNIKKDVSVTENFTEETNMVETIIKTKIEFKNTSLNQNTNASSVSILNMNSNCIPRKRIVYDEKKEELRKRTISVIKANQKLLNQNTNASSVSILNMNSNCIPRKRIIYDEKKEELRKRTMSVIKAKQKLLKHKIMQGKLIQSQNAKNIFIMQAESIQSEIDNNFQKLDELGKMPNHPKQNILVKPKLKKVECIKSFHILLKHLAGKKVNEVNIKNIHQFINFEIIEEAFDEFQLIKQQHLKKIEAAKQIMNLNLQNLFDFLKLNRDSFTSNASFPRKNATENIPSLCNSLQKNLQINFRHLGSFFLLTSNFLKSFQNYRMSEKLLFDEWNSFIFSDHKHFFTLKKIR